MTGEEEVVELCQECGATVYPEHLTRGLADRWEGRLLCVHCLRDKRSGSAAGTPAIILPPGGDEPIALVELESGSPGLLEDEPVTVEKKAPAIRSFGSSPAGMADRLGASKQQLRRQLLHGSPNATRAKTFHCKLADGPMAHMNAQINDWADGSDDIEIKFATACIGVVEGKHADPHMIVTVFY